MLCSSRTFYIVNVPTAIRPPAHSPMDVRTQRSDTLLCRRNHM